MILFGPNHSRSGPGLRLICRLLLLIKLFGKLLEVAGLRDRAG